MLSALLPFELKYHFKQVVFKVAAFLFICLGIIITQGNFGGPEIHKNAPYVISTIVCFLSLFSIFVSTLFCANVVLRDTTYEMDAIIFTTSLKRLPYFLVRLLGLLIAVFVILSLATLGIYLGSYLTSTDQLGPFNAGYYLQPLFVFGLPNILFCSSLIFSTALLTHSIRAVYVTGVSLFILYFLGSILGNSPMMASSLKTEESGLLPYLLDPFGLAAFFGETRSWSIAQRNGQFFAMKGVFLANRLLWTGIALGMLTLSYRYFKFRIPANARSRNKKQSEAPIKAIPYKSVATKPNGVTYQRSAFIAQLKLEVGSVFKHIPFLVMILLWIFLNGVDLQEEVLHGPYGIRFYMATGYIVEQLRSVRPALLVLVFYAAELIGRERATNIQGLIFSTPVRNTILWGAKCAALGVLAATLITANIVTGIGVQLWHGYMPIEWGTYASLYYYSALPLFLFALLIVFIQTVVPHKYLGMLLSLVVVGIFVFGRSLGITNYLLRYATLPDLKYTVMNGFGHYTSTVHWYLLYWASVAGVLSLLAAALWQGSTHTSLWQRVRSMGRQWGRTGKVLLMVSLLTWIATGIYIHNNTAGISTARGSKMAQDWQIAYEKKYKPSAHLPQPAIVAITTNVDLYPATGTYTVAGTYRLRNESGKPITTLWLGADPEVTTISFAVPGATLQTADPYFKQYQYRLKTPLLSGQEISLQFSMHVVRSGFMTFNSEHSVVSNGSYIELEKYVPFFGYNARYEVDDPTERKARGLPIADLRLPVADSNYHLIDFETTISTTADQQVITVGALQKKWSANNRNYFHYKTEQPIAYMFALSSARYAVQQETWQGIAFSIYYQPGQHHNVPIMMQAMKDAVSYGNAHFSPYPFKQLTLAEIPQYPGAATAYPGVLFSAERINFMSDYSDSTKFNNTYTVTAHETGHQWWSHTLAPLAVPGKALLTESMAKYTELMAAEKRFGRMHLRSFLQTDNKLYLDMRTMAGEQELPLEQSDQPFVYYQKGGLALYAIKEMLGEDSISQALQRLIRTHTSPHHKASPADLIYELHAVATPMQARHIDDQLKKVIVYDNRLRLIACDPLPNGQFSVQLQVSINKTDQTGATPQSLVPDDVITITVFDQPAEAWNPTTQPVYVQQHHFSKAVTVLTIITNKKPAVAAIDPWGYLPDTNQEDNIAPVLSKP